MEIQIDSVSRFHLEGSLYTCRWKLVLWRIISNGSLHQTANFRKFGFRIIIFLSIVITGNPPGGMIARHSKLGMFVLYHKVNQVLLLWKLITESYAIIIYTKTKVHITICSGLFQFNQQFVVVITNIFRLSPHRLPGFVEGRGRSFQDFKTIQQIIGILQFQSQGAGLNHEFPFILHLIGWSAILW